MDFYQLKNLLQIVTSQIRFKKLKTYFGSLAVASEALELQKLRLNKLHELLQDICNGISPAEKRRKIILYKFMDIEKKVRVEQLKLDLLIKKELKNEQYK
jgi:hypothetical protein